MAKTGRYRISVPVLCNDPDQALAAGSEDPTPPREPKIGPTRIKQAKQELKEIASTGVKPPDLVDHLRATDPVAAKVFDLRDERARRRAEQEAKAREEETQRQDDAKAIAAAEGARQRRLAVQKAVSILPHQNERRRERYRFLLQRAPKEFPGDAEWEAAVARIATARHALLAETARVNDQYQNQKTRLFDRIWAMGTTVFELASKIVRDVLGRDIEPEHAITLNGDGAAKTIDGLEEASDHSFAKWLREQAENSITAIQRAAQRLGVIPAVLKRLERAQPELDSIREIRAELRKLATEHAGVRPVDRDREIELEVEFANDDLARTTRDLKDAWVTEQPPTAEQAWLAAQPYDVIAEARDIVVAEANAARRAAEAAAAAKERAETLAREAEQIDRQIQTLSEGLEDVENRWTAAVDAPRNSKTLSAHLRELQAINANLYELKAVVRNAIDNRTGLREAERSLQAMQTIVADALKTYFNPDQARPWSQPGPGFG